MCACIVGEYDASTHIVGQVYPYSLTRHIAGEYSIHIVGEVYICSPTIFTHTNKAIVNKVSCQGSASIMPHHRRRRSCFKYSCFRRVLVPNTNLLSEWDQQISPQILGIAIMPHHRRRRYRFKYSCFRRVLVPINDLLSEWDQQINPQILGIAIISCRAPPCVATNVREMPHSNEECHA